MLGQPGLGRLELPWLRRTRRRISVPWLAIPAISCLLVLGILTYLQVGYWHDTPSFWLRTLALTQNNYVAHDTLGDFLASQGRTEEAAAQFRASLAIRPDDLPANLNLGTYEHGHGNLPSGQSNTTARITATTAKVRTTATMVCWLT